MRALLRGSTAWSSFRSSPAHLFVLVEGQCVLPEERPTLAEEHAADTIFLDGDLTFSQDATCSSPCVAI